MVKKLKFVSQSYFITPNIKIQYLYKNLVNFFAKVEVEYLDAQFVVEYLDTQFE